ncbi:uncharacterized protein METZ01_LOCUS158050 [marine metagenome]|uniref:Uncharacterized protein n=1 Tax=marine metagenome TaxID=408172 RepID=A0A382AUH9_9ZZZZ
MYIEGLLSLIKPRLFCMSKEAWIDDVGLILTASETCFFCVKDGG